MKSLLTFILKSHLLTISTGIVFTIPILFLFFSLTSFQADIWKHLSEYVLPEVFVSTGSLLLLVVLLTFFLGSSLAYFNTFYDYSGKKIFSVLNILPMSFPPYILAFIYIALFDVTGVFSLWLKDFLKLNTFFPSIRNVFGLALVLSLCLTPYIYLMAKQAFRTNGPFCFELGSSMGFSRFKRAVKLLMPMSLPTLISSLIIVAMEVLADFGTVSLFNVSTFSTAIYRSWFGLQSLDSAKQISLLLVLIVFVLMTLNWFVQRKKSTLIMAKQIKKVNAVKLTGLQNYLVVFFQCLYVFFAFILPVFTLIFWVLKSWSAEIDSRYFSYITHSLQFAAYTVLVLTTLGSFISYSERVHRNILSTLFRNLSSIGYALPGTVLAVGLFVMLTSLERALSIDNKMLTTSLLGLILGLSIRFFSVAYAPLEQSLTNLLPSHLQYLKITQIPTLPKFTRIYFPFLKPGLMTAALFVSVEVIKEIPMTLMMRPFGHETLATRIFELTSEGEWHRAALPSLFLIILCLISTIFLIYRENLNESK